MNDSESPLDRLNYFNGQRLEATDLQLEQAYHMRVRRWLNRTLHTAGIAAGLEVTVKAGDPHRVIVDQGLALDAEGREIILIEPREVLVVGLPSSTEGVVTGNYLTIRYGEEKTSRVDDSCTTISGDRRTGTHSLSWSGPSRVRANPIISWRDTWPPATSGEIVLAQVELDENCRVRNVITFNRQYTGNGLSSRLRMYALEGEKDIDPNNPKRIYFHIRSGRPEAVTIYLRGEHFSTLFYTELGQHTHPSRGEMQPAGSIPSHSHSLQTLTTSEWGNGQGYHRHVITADIDEDIERGSIEVHDEVERAGVNLNEKVKMTISEEGGHDHKHSHTIATGGRTDSVDGRPDHTHAINVFVDNAGATNRARSGAALTYIKDLQIVVDGTNYTREILTQLGWQSIGTGTNDSQDIFNNSGTGPIRLDLLGEDFTEGEHYIDLKVAEGGGRVLYNLYVE